MLALAGTAKFLQSSKGRKWTIVAAPRGGGGFGYDPVFVPDGHAQTFAELGETVKNQISHRAQAIAGLRAERRF